MNVDQATLEARWRNLPDRLAETEELDALLGHEVRWLGRHARAMPDRNAVAEFVCRFYAFERMLWARETDIREGARPADWDPIVEDGRVRCLAAVQTVLSGLSPATPRLGRPHLRLVGSRAC